MAKQDKKSKKGKKTLKAYGVDPVRDMEITDKLRTKKNKKKLKKLKQLQKVITDAEVRTPFTDKEKAVFNARIKNEKSNIWRIGNRDPQSIIDHINANVADEKNAAVRFARRDAKAWAQRELQPVTVPY